MEKQTAVGWLLFEMSKNGLLPNGIPNEIHNQAKEMEKQQIIEQQIALQIRDGKKRNPLDDIIGKWPGNETDEEFEQMLKLEKQITPITPEALIELGFIDTSYDDLGITFTQFTYYHELFEIHVYGDNVVDLKLGFDWQSTNATTIEDIKHLIRLFA